MTWRNGLFTLAAASMMAGTALTPVEPVQAQIPAFLPNKDAVPQTEAMEIDGDWRVNTIRKIIRIERGRAYAVEGWLHALVLRVQPDMVTIRNIQQINDTEYVGDDLPMMGRVTMKLVAPDRIEASVPGMFGPVRYTLTRVSAAGSGGDRDSPALSPPAMFVSPGVPDERAQPAPPQGPRPDFASLAQAFGDQRPVEETFRGCAIPDQQRRNLSAPAPAPAPRDRMTNRQFAPVAGDSPDPAGAEKDDTCWTRLDGVWSQDRDPVFDTSFNNANRWRAPGMSPNLLHGTYTTPETLFIAAGSDPVSELFVMSGTNALRWVRYTSSDSIEVEDLIGQVGVRKVYETQERNGLGRRLTVDYTAGGDLRIRLGDRQFLRPAAAPLRDLDSDDVFALQFQTDNFAGNLKGYDVLTQDPFRLMQNDKNAVFARRKLNEYRIQEKYAVPFGFKLQNVLDQGSIYKNSVVSSESEIQDAITSSFGINAKVSVSGAVNSVLAFVPGTGQVEDTGYSVGFNSTKSTMSTLRNSRSVAQVVGYSRTKSYAIILDHAEAELSSSFLTAVADAQLEGRYDDLIERFGTHYAYAVTYGANGKMTRNITTESFQNALAESKGNRLEGEVSVVGSSIGGFSESMKSNLNTSSGSVTNENGTFEAVGGNGSWNEGGFARGDRVVPILLDLRPLDELLNPINFPDQPDVYTRVRTELALAINRYLAGRAQPLSNERLISQVAYVPPPPEPGPEVGPEPEKEQEWHVYIKSIDCIKARWDGKLGYEGKATIKVVEGGTETAQVKRLEGKCKKRSTTRTDYRYNRRTAQEGLLIIRGTQTELRNRKIRISYEWDYKPGWKKTTSSVDLFLRDYFDLRDGKYRELKKKVTQKNNPDLSIQVRVRNAD
ncbi:MAG: MAC/perforin domain-containing protein [Pseudomonadota bacterium]